jgi:hypothetical protein
VDGQALLPTSTTLVVPPFVLLLLALLLGWPLLTAYLDCKSGCAMPWATAVLLWSRFIRQWAIGALLLRRLLVAVPWVQLLHLAILAGFPGSLLLGMFAILLVPVLLLVLPMASLPLRLFGPGMLLSPIVHLRFTVPIESRFPFPSGRLVRGWPLSSGRRFLPIGLMMMFAFELVGIGAVEGFWVLGWVALVLALWCLSFCFPALRL